MSNYKFTINADGIITEFTHLDVTVTDIVIPAEIDGVKVTGIGYRAFYNNIFITSVTIQEGVTSIGEMAFVLCGNLENVILPSTLTRIGISSFAFCESLTSVTIPSSVTSIDNLAFYGCTSLTDVYYNGTQEQWDKISISDSNYKLTNATIHFANIND